MILASSVLTAYKLVLALHILGAVVWVGGGFTAQLLGLRATRSQSPERQAGFAQDISVIGQRAYIPASLVLIGSGVWLVHDGRFGFGTAWVTIGLAVWVASFLAGATFLGPQSAKLARDIQAAGISSPQAQRRLRGIFLYSRIELVFLLVVVVDMVLKPGQ